jgi:hypothetical protein
MPQVPFVISGYVYSYDGSTAVAGATISAVNKTTGEVLVSETTSNSLGGYIIDLANSKNSYTNGDVITIEAKSGYRYAQHNFTLNTTPGFLDVNLTLYYQDNLGVVIEFLNDNWDKSRTDGILPIIGPIFDYKELEMGNQDYVLIYEVDEQNKPFGMGGIEFHEESRISIDVRTSYKQSSMSDVRMHLVKMKKELGRIIEGKINPKIYNGYYNLWMIDKRDFSDKMRGLGRIVIDCTLKRIEVVS